MILPRRLTGQRSLQVGDSYGPLKLLRISHLEDDTVTTIEVRGFLGHSSQTRMDQL